MKAQHKIRVCQVLEATEGGTREHLRQIAMHLDRDAFELAFVVSPLRAPDFGRDMDLMRGLGHEVFVLPMHRAIRPLADMRAIARLWRFLRGGRFDIVHTHSSKAGVLGRVAAWPARTPVRIHTPHVLPFLQETGAARQWLYRTVERLVGRITTTFVALSEFERRTLIESGVAREEQAVVIHNGIESRGPTAPGEAAAKRRALGIDGDAFAVLAVGRLVPQKGHAVLVEAARRVVDALPSAQFVVAGEGELRPELEAQIERLDLADNVRLIGHRDDVRELLPAFDLFVLPSLWEAMPYTVLEAQDAGLPIVASDVCGLAEFLPHGRLVRPKDAAALADAMLKLVYDDGERRRLGRLGRKVVLDRFPVGKCIAELASLYRTSVR